MKGGGVLNLEHEKKFEKFYLEYSDQMIRRANGFVKDKEEAKDIVHNAFIKFFRYVNDAFDYKDNSKIALMDTIVCRLALNAIRDRKKHNQSNIIDFQYILEDEEILTPEEYVIKEEKKEVIAKKVALLNKDYADVLMLKYVYEYTNEEIADIMCISEGACRTKLSRARKAIKKMLGDNEFEIY